MLNLIKRWTNRPIDHLELVSIHLPKTGGTSFFNVIQDIYGPDHCLEIKRELALETRYRFDELIGQQHRAIHGHFHYSEIKNILHKNTKVVTWMRDPVERVISNYFFFHRRVNETPNHRESHRKNESLQTYAGLEENQNRMSKFLKGIKIEELFFVGILESFDQDLVKLSQLMGWNLPKRTPKLNANQNYKHQFQQVTPELKSLIKSWNLDDVDLYDRATKLRDAN